MIYENVLKQAFSRIACENANIRNFLRFQTEQYKWIFFRTMSHLAVVSSTYVDMLTKYTDFFEKLKLKLWLCVLG